MANEIVTMSKLKRAFQMLAVQIPQRQICEQLHMGTYSGLYRFIQGQNSAISMSGHYWMTVDSE